MKNTQCPICGKETYFQQEDVRNPYFPFCSQRCRWVDLAHWLDGTYRIGSEQPVSEEELTPQGNGEADGEPDGALE